MKKLLILVLLFVLGSYSVISVEANTRPIMICTVEGECYAAGPGGGGGSSGDTVAPVITANTDTLVVQAWSNTYTQPTCSAIDAVDGEVPCLVTGSVNTHKIGWYMLTFTAKDSKGNTATRYKHIQVKNDRINEDLFPFDYCKSGYTTFPNAEQINTCNRLRSTYTLLSQASAVTQVGSSLYVESIVEIPLNEYNSRLDQPYTKVGENLTGSYIGKVTTYQSSNRKSFSSGGYYYKFVQGWNWFSHSDDYHSVYEIYGKYKMTTYSPKTINLSNLDPNSVYMRKYAEYVSSFTCSMVASMYQECHHMVNQYYVPVEQVKDHLDSYLISLAFKLDPTFNIFDFMEPGGWIALESLYLYFVSKGFLASTSGVLAITPVTVGALMLHILQYTSNFINTDHGNKVKTMLKTAYDFALNPNNSGKYLVFTEANRLSFDNMEAGLFPSQAHKIPRPDSDFDKKDVLYRYTVTPYTKQTLSHIISRDELVSARVEVVFADTSAILYADIIHLESFNIDNLFKNFVLFKTP